MTDNMKPVPCGCGGEAMLYVSPITTRCYLQCESCKIETAFYDTEAEAIMAWNRAMGGKDGEGGRQEMAKRFDLEWWRLLVRKMS